MAFVQRQIILTITLQSRQGEPAKGIAADQNPAFSGTNSNTVRIVGGGFDGLRISAKVTKTGAPGFGEAVVQIYNLPSTLINQIGTLGVTYIMMTGKNLITIEAGDVGAQPTKIFSGTINQAYADFSGAPDSIFNIAATEFGFEAVAPADAVSIPGSSSVVTIFENLAAAAGLKLINTFTDGAAPMLSNTYLSGSLRDQIRRLAKAGGVSYVVDIAKGTITIGPKNFGLAIPGAPVPVIGPPPTGKMVGYPSYTQAGVKVKTEFTTDISFGEVVKVEGSALTQANGTFWVYYLDHDLECQAPDGPWFTNLELAVSPLVAPTSSAP